jgi:long-subunit acyl-CoA synthetase (AMP-forming)
MTLAPTTSATVAGAFLDTVARTPDAVALHGDHLTLTWAELAHRVAEGAGALQALGVRRGDTVATLLANRPEQWIADLAITFCGATVCPLYTTLPANDIELVTRDAGARLIITERALRAGVQHTEPILVDALRSAVPIDLDAATIDPDATAVVIYTSGTTARPKGVELTHAALLASVRAWQQALDLGDVQRLISWLPNAHVMDRVLHASLALVQGLETTTCADPRTIANYLPRVRPHLFIAVPRVWEKLKAGIEQALDQQPPERRDAARAAIAAGLQRVRLQQAGKPVPAALEQAVARADAALFAGLRERLGLDHVVVAGSGAAPISRDVLEFFHAIGIELLEGYALSESGCAGAVGRRGHPRIGTVGRPLDGVELRLAPDGEILLRAESVMRGYRGGEESPVDADGWLHTGDLGTLDGNGDLTIVDRKKEIIITAGGKNISPARVESELKAASPLIAHACAVGDRRPYLTALLVLEPGADPAAVPSAIEVANQRLARVEQIKRYTILEAQWVPGGPELTPTQKLKRRSVLARHVTEIDAMYASA